MVSNIRHSEPGDYEAFHKTFRRAKGHLVDVDDDLDGLLRRIDVIERDNLSTLRLCTFKE